MKPYSILVLLLFAHVRAEDDPLKCYLLAKVANSDDCIIETRIGEKECARFDSKEERRNRDKPSCLSSENRETFACFCKGADCPTTEELIKELFHEFLFAFKKWNENVVHKRSACMKKAVLYEASDVMVTTSGRTSSRGASSNHVFNVYISWTPAPNTTVATTTNIPGTKPDVASPSSPSTTPFLEITTAEKTNTPTATTNDQQEPTLSPQYPINNSDNSGVNGSVKSDNCSEPCQACDDKTFLYVALAVLSTLLAGTWVICLYSCIKNRKKVEPKQAEVLPTKVSRSAAPEVVVPVHVNEEKVKSNPAPQHPEAPPTLGRVDIQNVDTGFGAETTDESSTISTTTTTTNQG